MTEENVLIVPEETKTVEETKSRRSHHRRHSSSDDDFGSEWSGWRLSTRSKQFINNELFAVGQKIVLEFETNTSSRRKTRGNRDSFENSVKYAQIHFREDEEVDITARGKHGSLFGLNVKYSIEPTDFYYKLKLSWRGREGQNSVDIPFFHRTFYGTVQNTQRSTMIGLVLSFNDKEMLLGIYRPKALYGDERRGVLPVKYTILHPTKAATVLKSGKLKFESQVPNVNWSTWKLQLE